MKLYYAPETCSLSPHIVLQELHLPYALVRVNNRTKQTSEGGNFLAINPKGYVAALMLDHGAVLTEGPAIVQYLADLQPEAGLIPAPRTLERVRVQEWLNFISTEVHGGSSLLFNPDLDATARQSITTKLTQRFTWMAAHLAIQDYLMADGFTVADAYLFAVLNWMARLAIDLDRWPALANYQRRIAVRPSVINALAREAAIPPVI